MSGMERTANNAETSENNINRFYPGSATIVFQSF
jgi:hypothetical protein